MVLSPNEQMFVKEFILSTTEIVKIERYEHKSNYQFKIHYKRLDTEHKDASIPAHTQEALFLCLHFNCVHGLRMIFDILNIPDTLTFKEKMCYYELGLTDD